MNLKDSVRYLPAVGPVLAKRLQKLKIETVRDLLWHLPFRYDDFSLISKINSLQPGEIVTIDGRLLFIKNLYTKSRKQIQTAEIDDGTGIIKAIWFNQPFLANTLEAGIEICLSGKVSGFVNRYQMESPEYEVVKSNVPLLNTGRLVPVYPETKGISSKWLRARISQVLNSNTVNEHLPAALISKNQLLPIDLAFKTIHFPPNRESLTPARRRLSYDELFLLQLQSLYKKMSWQKNSSGTPLEIDQKKLENFINLLPFKLTKSQNKVLNEIYPDIQKSQAMNRLLEGDVGSGKTVIAAVIAYITYLNSYKTILMAPTEILAQQHFATFENIFKHLDIKILLLTSHHKIKDKGVDFDIIIGTHALLDKKKLFMGVKFVVIDEQHRFGVRQRALLRQKGETPHVLTLTATPIPRTIVLTLYGDLDLSILDEMPAGRIPVKTWVVPLHKRNAAYSWIRQKIISSQFKENVFIVCPFIEISESQTTVKAATHEYLYLKEKVFTDLNIGLLHGKMKPQEKNAILDNFRHGNLNILVCTPVVEVGIDIPTATIMLIEGAERFGLAQLHQLRGRVGRGVTQSFCLLFTESDNLNTLNRLKYLEKTYSGPELSEFDLKRRGGGDIFGFSQHGFKLLKAASFSDLNLIKLAKNDAQNILGTDPELDNFPSLKELAISSTITEVTPD